MKQSNYNIYVKVDEGYYVIYNTLNGSAVIVDSEALSVIEKNMLNVLPQESLQSLVQNGILLEDNEDEFAIYSYKFFRSRYENSQLHVTIIPTYACNLSCKYCLQGGGFSNKTMDINSAKRLVQALDNYLKTNDYDDLIIDFYGGEPLLAKDVVLFILENMEKIYKENGVTMSSTIVTNGTLITEEVVDKIFSCHQFAYIQITLDGNRDIHNKRRPYKHGKGTYDDIIRGLKLLSKTRNPVILRMNVDIENESKENWIDMLHDLHSIDGVNIFFNPARVEAETPECRDYESFCIPKERVYKVLKRIEEEARQFVPVLSSRPQPFQLCIFMRDSAFVIDPSLNIYKCPEMIANEEFKIGYIDSKGEIQFNNTFYKMIQRDPTKMQMCKPCPILPLCNGGCAATAKYKKGNYQLPYCSEEFKAMIEEYAIRCYLNWRERYDNDI